MATDGLRREIEGKHSIFQYSLSKSHIEKNTERYKGQWDHWDTDNLFLECKDMFSEDTD